MSGTANEAFSPVATKVRALYDSAMTDMGNRCREKGFGLATPEGYVIGRAIVIGLVADITRYSLIAAGTKEMSEADFQYVAGRLRRYANFFNAKLDVLNNIARIKRVFDIAQAEEPDAVPSAFMSDVNDLFESGRSEIEYGWKSAGVGETSLERWTIEKEISREVTKMIIELALEAAGEADSKMTLIDLSEIGAILESLSYFNGLDVTKAIAQVRDTFRTVRVADQEQVDFDGRN
jgi:hypothetical protein